MRQAPRLYICLLCLLCLTVGCNNKQKVSGHVTFPDGSPVPTGTLFFSTDSYLGRAPLNADGTYDVTSLKSKDGLPKGTYKVYLVGCYDSDLGVTTTKTKNVGSSTAETDVKRTAVDRSNNLIKVTPLVDPKFTTAETTPLTFEVPGARNFDFTVERYPEKKK